VVLGARDRHAAGLLTKLGRWSHLTDQQVALMEIKPMKDVIEKAIVELTKKSSEAVEPHHAMNFAQAALNLAHALKTIS